MKPADEIASHVQPDYITLFRLGDYWEVFDKDADIVSCILGLTKTTNRGHKAAGFPAHRLEYIDKLIKAGCRVATNEAFNQ